MKTNQSGIKNITLFLLFLLSPINLWSQQYKQTNQGLLTTINNVDIEVQFFSPEIIRILKHPTGSFLYKKSLSVIKSPEATLLKTDVDGYNLSVKSYSTEVKIDKRTGQIRFYTPLGLPLLCENKPH